MERIAFLHKSTWDIDDYPLRFRRQEVYADQPRFGVAKPWLVQIINWWVMSGTGDTKQAAFENLKDNFRVYLENNRAPRPGKQVPLKFASTSQIEKLEDEAVDFFERILNMDYHRCFISDTSRLSDLGKDEDEILRKINVIYGLDLEDLGDGNIVLILVQIKTRASK